MPGRSRHTLLAALAMALCATLAPHAAASATAPALAPGASRKQISEVAIPFNRHLFGVHDMHLSSLSRPSTGSIRLWDTATDWTTIQTGRHSFDFTRLDRIVTAAHANGTEVTLVVATTPQFASPDPSSPTYQTEMPKVRAFRRYVATVMRRYRDFFGPGVSGIANYQVWNEANIDTFWTGTPAQMATLTRVVWRVRNRVDPSAVVVAPALESRMAYQRAWLRRFYAERLGGRPVWRYVDAISLNLYPLDSYGGHPGTPEDSMRLLGKARELMSRDGVPSTLAVWNTEVNYGLRAGQPGGTPAVPISYELQAAYVMRTYLLNEAEGVGRVFWYAYDMGDLPATRGGLPLANTLLTTPSDRVTLTPAGQAFDRVRAWLHGTLLGSSGGAPCPVDIKGTYVCTMRYRSGKIGRIYWNPYRTVRMPIARTAYKVVNELGTATALRGVRHLRVGYAPLLVKSPE